MSIKCRSFYVTVRRKTSFFGNDKRRGALANIMTTGTINGRRGRGRQAEMMLDAVRK